MHENPYKFTGPLHPIHDELICMSREKELEQVISGILHGDFWTILGPRQIGKTTFLNQLIHELSAFNCIYFDMESCPKAEEVFYSWLEDTIIDSFAKNTLKIHKTDKKDYGHEINFYNFLSSIEEKGHKKIVLLFDEIERLPFVKSFLKLWRKIFNERNFHPELKKYAVVIAGSVDLIELTIGRTSPFNISKKLYLDELSPNFAELLMNQPVKKIGIQFDPEVKNEIINQTSCHPQLLQHLCYLIVSQASGHDAAFTKSDVESAIEILFVESDNLSSLANEIKSDSTLRELIEKMLSKDDVPYLPYKKYSIAGTGPIAQQKKLCALRNKIYEDFIGNIIDHTFSYKDAAEEADYLIKIFIKDHSKNILLNQSHEKLLKYLFSSDSFEIEIARNGIKLPGLELEIKERIIFCYLAYKKYQAIQKGFSDWKKIPLGCDFRLSSNVKNNEGQIEWEILEDSFSSRRITIYNEIIRTWVLSIRQKLKLIDARDLIPIETGRGRGYVMKGKIEFSFD